MVKNCFLLYSYYYFEYCSTNQQWQYRKGQDNSGDYLPMHCTCPNSELFFRAEASIVLSFEEMLVIIVSFKTFTLSQKFLSKLFFPFLIITGIYLFIYLFKNSKTLFWLMHL